MAEAPSQPQQQQSSGPSAGGPSPAMIFDTINAYQQTFALKAAVELDVFTAIGEHPDGATAAQLAPRCGAAERGMRILCDGLVLLDFLTKDNARQPRYRLSEVAATFLDKRSPAYFGGVTQFLLAPHIRGGFENLTSAVRRGGTVMGERHDGTVAPEHPVWVDFARAMAPAMSMAATKLAELLDPAPDASRPLRILDVAAGHGLFGISIARRNPAAHVTALDWSTVLAVAKENAKAVGLGDDRYATIAGSAFDAPLGGPYDLVLLTNFLHHFNWTECEDVLRRFHAVTAPGGRAVILEFAPDDDRVTPADMAGFALTMLATTPEGDAYTVREYQSMLKTAGYRDPEMHPLPPTNERVVLARRA